MTSADVFYSRIIQSFDFSHKLNVMALFRRLPDTHNIKVIKYFIVFECGKNMSLIFFYFFKCERELNYFQHAYKNIHIYVDR